MQPQSAHRVHKNNDYTHTLHLGNVYSTIVMPSTPLEEILNTADMLIIDSGMEAYILSYITHGRYIIVPGGDITKNDVFISEILEMCFRQGLTRESTVTVIGGGAVCDVGAFACSVYLRGIRVTLIPSTLLAMVDASVGGKTGINYRYWKNMIGTFYPATNIFIYPTLLSTLSFVHIKCGLAEIIKAGMLQDNTILNMLEQQVPVYENSETSLDERLRSITDIEFLKVLIWKSVMVKCAIVQEDFREENARAFLNLGHTFAHAIETCARECNQHWQHGKAVGLGIRTALLLGTQLGITDITYAEYMIKLLDTFGYPCDYHGFSADRLLHAMQVDKKRNSKGVRFVLQHTQGNTCIQFVDCSHVHAVLRQLKAS